MTGRRNVARLVVATAAAFIAIFPLTYVFRGIGGALLAGFVPGVLAASAVRSRRDGVCSAIGAALAFVVLAASVSSGFVAARFGAVLAANLEWALVLTASAAIGGLSGSLALELWGGDARRWLLIGAVGIAVVGGGSAAIAAANAPDMFGSRPGLTLSGWMATAPDLARHRDADLYLREYQLVAQGRSYYDAVFAARIEADPTHTPSKDGAVRFKLPTLLWLWARSPFTPFVTLSGGLLVLAAVAAFSAFALGQRIGHPSLAAACAVAVAVYISAYAGSTTVTFSEPWAAVAVLLSAAAWANHLAHKADRAWLITAVLAGLLAALMRELAVFVLVAGLVSALTLSGHRRRVGLAAWGSALAAFFVAYAAHILRLGGRLFGGDAAVSQWTRLSPLRQLAIAQQGDRFLLGLAWLSVAVVALALVGALFSPLPGWRGFAIFAAVLPVFVFSLVGPTGTLAPGAPQVPLGYWGILVKPLLWAMLPAAVYVMWPARATAEKDEGTRAA